MEQAGTDAGSAVLMHETSQCFIAVIGREVAHVRAIIKTTGHDWHHVVGGVTRLRTSGEGE